MRGSSPGRITICGHGVRGLARTATGKLQKFKLREPFWAGRDRLVS